MVCCEEATEQDRRRIENRIDKEKEIHTKEHNEYKKKKDRYKIVSGKKWHET